MKLWLILLKTLRKSGTKGNTTGMISAETLRSITNKKAPQYCGAFCLFQSLLFNNKRITESYICQDSRIRQCFKECYKCFLLGIGQAKLNRRRWRQFGISYRPVMINIQLQKELCGTHSSKL